MIISTLVSSYQEFALSSGIIVSSRKCNTPISTMTILTRLHKAEVFPNPYVKIRFAGLLEIHSENRNNPTENKSTTRLADSLRLVDDWNRKPIKN